MLKYESIYMGKLRTGNDTYW